jgi:hypothetical protein
VRRLAHRVAARLRAPGRASTSACAERGGRQCRS